MTRGSDNWWRQPRHPTRPPFIIAHRGNSAFCPENTLEAARIAHQLGADAWELDVHLTRDLVPVVIHDESLIRTTNVREAFPDDPRADAGYPVADFDVAEIQRLDAASWFIAPDGGDRSAKSFGTLAAVPAAKRGFYASGAIRIPTLAEALALTVELAWPVNVELKSVPSGQDEIVVFVMGQIAAANAEHLALISSFDHGLVAEVAAHYPFVATAALTTTPLYHPGGYCKNWIAADAYHPSIEAIGAGSVAYRRHPDRSTLRIEDFEEARAWGVAVSVFTVNDYRPRGLADHLRQAGVFGVFTDFPGELAKHWNGGLRGLH
jgi:glycerophosphoryl diester phosphodiesterase